MEGFLVLPPLLQAALGAAALLVAGLTAWRGVRGLCVAVGASLGVFLAFSLGASFLVGRLEGGGATLRDMVPGAFAALVRLAVIWLPLAAAGALAGWAGRWFRSRKPRRG